MSQSYTLFSGAARGADGLFSQIASEYEIDIIHYRPVGNEKVTSKYMKNHSYQLKIADEARLIGAQSAIKDLIGLDIPLTFAGKLKLRNYYQVNKAEAIFAVASLVYNSDSRFKYVEGGTDIAIQLGVARKIPVYVLDTNSCIWNEYDPISKSFIEMNDIPVLPSKFAAIGTRKLEQYDVLDKATNQWVPADSFDTQTINDLKAQMIRVFKATFN